MVVSPPASGPASPIGVDMTAVVSPAGIGAVLPAMAMVPCGANAAAISRMPRPKVVSVPAAPASCAVRSSRSTTWAAVRLGKAWRSSAAAPATCGAEKLVPEMT